MNSKGHLTFSIIKSSMRITFCAVGLIFKDPFIFMFGFILAEILGIFEEFVDKR